MYGTREANTVAATFIATTPAILGVVLLIAIVSLLMVGVALGAFALAGALSFLLFGRRSPPIILVSMVVLGLDLFEWPRWPVFHDISALFSSANAWVQTHPNFVTLMVDAMAHIALKYVWGGFWHLVGLVFHLPVSAIIWLIGQFAELSFRMFGEPGLEGGCLVARLALGDVLLIPMALADIRDTLCQTEDGGLAFLLLDHILFAMGFEFHWWPSSGTYVYNAAQAFFFPFESAPSVIKDADHFWPFASTLAFMVGGLWTAVLIARRRMMMLVHDDRVATTSGRSMGGAPRLASAKAIDGERGLFLLLGFGLWLPLMVLWAFLLRPWMTG